MTQCQPVRIGGAGVGHDVEKGVTALLAGPVFKRGIQRGRQLGQREQVADILHRPTERDGLGVDPHRPVPQTLAGSSGFEGATRLVDLVQFTHHVDR